MATHHWSTLTVLESDGETEVRNEESRLHALLQLYTTACMEGYFLARVYEAHEDGDEASTWGPRDEDIDWTGFDGTARDENDTPVVYATHEEASAWRRVMSGMGEPYPDALRALSARSCALREATGRTVEVYAPGERLPLYTDCEPVELD